MRGRLASSKLSEHTTFWRRFPTQAGGPLWGQPSTGNRRRRRLCENAAEIEASSGRTLKTAIKTQCVSIFPPPYNPSPIAADSLPPTLKSAPKSAQPGSSAHTIQAQRTIPIRSVHLPSQNPPVFSQNGTNPPLSSNRRVIHNLWAHFSVAPNKQPPPLSIFHKHPPFDRDKSHTYLAFLTNFLVNYKQYFYE